MSLLVPPPSDYALTIPSGDGLPRCPPSPCKSNSGCSTVTTDTDPSPETPPLLPTDFPLSSDRKPHEGQGEKAVSREGGVSQEGGLVYDEPRSRGASVSSATYDSPVAYGSSWEKVALRGAGREREAVGSAPEPSSSRTSSSSLLPDNSYAHQSQISLLPPSPSLNRARPPSPLDLPISLNSAFPPQAFLPSPSSTVRSHTSATTTASSSSDDEALYCLGMKVRENLRKRPGFLQGGGDAMVAESPLSETPGILGRPFEHMQERRHVNDGVMGVSRQSSARLGERGDAAAPPSASPPPLLHHGSSSSTVHPLSAAGLTSPSTSSFKLLRTPPKPSHSSSKNARSQTLPPPSLHQPPNLTLPPSQSFTLSPYRQTIDSSLPPSSMMKPLLSPVAIQQASSSLAQLQFSPSRSSTTSSYSIPTPSSAFPPSPARSASIDLVGGGTSIVSSTSQSNLSLLRSPQKKRPSLSVNTNASPTKPHHRRRSHHQTEPPPPLAVPFPNPPTTTILSASPEKILSSSVSSSSSASLGHARPPRPSLSLLSLNNPNSPYSSSSLTPPSTSHPHRTVSLDIPPPSTGPFAARPQLLSTSVSFHRPKSMGSSLASKKASRGLMAIQTNLGVGGERGSLSRASTSNGGGQLVTRVQGELSSRRTPSSSASSSDHSHASRSSGGSRSGRQPSASSSRGSSSVPSSLALNPNSNFSPQTPHPFQHRPPFILTGDGPNRASPEAISPASRSCSGSCSRSRSRTPSPSSTSSYPSSPRSASPSSSESSPTSPTTFTLSTILPSQLFLGPDPSSPSALATLKANGVAWVLNMAVECEDEYDIEGQFERYLKVGLRDCVEEKGVENGLRLGCDFLGTSRSPLHQDSINFLERPVFERWTSLLTSIYPPLLSFRPFARQTTPASTPNPSTSTAERVNPAPSPSSLPTSSRPTAGHSRKPTTLSSISVKGSRPTWGLWLRFVLHLDYSFFPIFRTG
jgi:hypothetical protein